MTAKEGRKKSVRVLVAVGNGNGAAGEWGGITPGGGGGGGGSWARPGLAENLRVHVAGLISLLVKPFSGLGSQTQIFTM